MKNHLPLWLAKIIYYEYWPVNRFYFPFAFYWLFLSLRARSITYYTAVNPAIEHSGFWGNSKSDILKIIPSDYLPASLFFSANDSTENILSSMHEAGLQFPVICKPDKGERGYKVEKINSAEELKTYVHKADDRFIVQEFVTWPIELGILYYRLPDGTKSEITSVTRKAFLSVTGDGISTIDELMNQSLRARFQLISTRKKFDKKMNHILPAGETFLIEPIGNHCRGTEFINVNDLINPQLIAVFDNIAAQIPGFYYGRFDLKVKSLDDLYVGKNIKIMELNGVTSEPAHIYGNNMNLLKAAQSVILHSNIIFKIAMQNKKRGVLFTPFFPFLKHLMNYKSLLKATR
ncbi:MAG TPA: hypothetical protein PLD87_11960 [Bacteroidia bacterium]|nr:hypothetical protein [Bacteroidia bacterium]